MTSYQRRPAVRAVHVACLCVLLGGAGLMPARADARQAGTNLVLRGAGSTFDAPFFATAFGHYSSTTPVTINYQPVGSGAGIQAFIANQVDFAASDVPMNQLELALASSNGGPVVQFPIVLGAVAIVYNEPKIMEHGPIRLDGVTLAGIFLGKITRWSDPAIASLNPTITLPNDSIQPVHRSDSSGTTYIFTDYLSAVNGEWASSMSKGKSVAWPTGFHGQGSAGVAAWVRGHEGAIGYVELKYAFDNKLRFLALKNRAGVYQAPSQESARAAAAQFPDVSARSFSIVDAPGSQSYPIAGYSWVILRQHPSRAMAGAALVRLFSWLSSAGQIYAGQLHYVPLPNEARRVTTEALSSIATTASTAQGTRPARLDHGQT